MYDIIIKGGNLFLKDAPLQIGKDIGIKDGKIVEVSDFIDETNSQNVINAFEKLISPSYMDTHMHIDKAYTMDNDNTLSLIAACKNSDEKDIEYYGWSDEEIYEDIMKHSSRVIENCISHGTTLVKTNVLFSSQWRTIALDVMMDLKKKYKNYCEILNCVSYPPQFKEELLKATKEGKVDVVGGYPHLCRNHMEVTDECFDIAQQFGLPLDLHCDESDTTNLDCFKYICEKTQQTGMQGKVTCGHVTALNSTDISEDLVNFCIEKAASVKMNVTSLTSCNMYLMNRTRRGPTRVQQLLESDVNVAVASDNIRDTFRPFGNCNLMEEALLTAKVHKFSTTSWLHKTLELVTYNAAINAGALNYGLTEGCIANLNILDAPTPYEAIKNRAKCLYSLKNGKVTVKNEKIDRAYME